MPPALLMEAAAVLAGNSGVRQPWPRRVQRLLIGSTAVELAAWAHCPVVVVRGAARAGSVLLGSTSQHLLHHAPCPVAVVRTAAEDN